MLLTDLVAASRRIGGHAGRLQKIEELASLLRRAGAEEVEIAGAFLSGSLRQGRIGVGGALLQSARPPAAAEPSLTLREVDETFARIAAAAGAGSSAARGSLLSQLMSRATAEEQDFLVRLLFGELRQGAQEGLMIEALARATSLPVDAVRRAVMAEGEIGPVASIAFREGEEGLKKAAIRLFRPVRPMLAQPSDDVSSAFERMENPALEYKLDGARVQIHKAGDEVRVFTRGLQDVTPAVPEIVEAARLLRAHELILDGEAISLRSDGTPQPFQDTMRRFGRKVEVEALRKELPLSLFLFDALYLEGRPLIDLPYRLRSDFLAEHVGRTNAAPGPGVPLVVPRAFARRPSDAEEFLAQALAAGHEGIMMKDPQATYEAGSRGSSWLKLKKVETLDLVVLAAEWGNGRRQGWLSNLHLGARDPANDSFVMLGKTFKGMTDAMLAWQTEKLLALEIARDGHVVHVRPELVVEIAFADLQRSPRYPAGLALRFARVKRYRPEKTASQADTIERVREIHRRATGEALRGE